MAARATHGSENRLSARLEPGGPPKW